MARPRFGVQISVLLYADPGERDEIEALITATGLRPIRLGDSHNALAATDALARLWFLLALDRGHGRRVGFRILTAAADDC